MIMNSNVYGAAVCHNGAAANDYQNYHPDLTYYSGSTDLSVTTSTGVPTHPTSNHYAPTLHMSTAGTHQFGDPSGIISETNGLSYTNLDTQPHYATNPVPPHHQRLSHYGEAARAGPGVPQAPPIGPSVAQGPPQLTVVNSNHQSFSNQYRDFSDGGQLAAHPDMVSAVSALSDCAVRTSVSGQVGNGGQYYLDPSLLSRRNGTSTHQALHSYVDSSSFTDMTCNQLNGSPYHLNHLSHLHHPPHHHHHHHGGARHAGGNSVIAAAPVPQYKWMQVKRNIPKPGELTPNKITC